MPSISDLSLAGGAVASVAAVHGESIIVTFGKLAGLTFYGVIEAGQDEIITTALGEDPRGKWFIRFDLNGNVPGLQSQDRFIDESNRIWKVVKIFAGSYLTQDYEIIEEVPGLDS